MFNPIENGTNCLLREFSEEYIRLAELIILFDKEEWDLIEDAEKSVKIKMLMGEKTAFANQQAASTHFIREKVLLITNNINRSSAVKMAQANLSRYVSQHKIEKKYLGLAFSKPPLLTPSEIYANYYCLVEKLPGLTIPEQYGKKK